MIRVVALRRFPASGAIAGKDLRLRLRGWRWAGVITLYSGILCVVALAFLLQRYDPGAADTQGLPARTGVHLVQMLSIIQLLLITLITPASVAGAISGERQHRTWDLLMASRLSALDIVWGKLLAGVAFNLLLLAATLPLFALVFLFGGVGFADLIPTFAVLLATILLLCAVSLTVSALTARLVVSFTVSIVLSLLLTLGVSLLVVYLQSPGPPNLLTLAGIPVQTDNLPSPLPPVAQIDPLVALLSALPADSGGSLLGGIGTISHAFGFGWRLPLWGAYTLLAAVLSLILVLATTRPVRSALPWQYSTPRR